MSYKKSPLTQGMLKFSWTFLLIYPPSAYKKGAQPKPRTEKAQAPIAAKQTFDK